MLEFSNVGASYAGLAALKDVTLHHVVVCVGKSRC